MQYSICSCTETRLTARIRQKHECIQFLLRAPGAFALRAALRRLFTPLSAASFLTFTLLYTPCAAAFGAARRELGSTKTALCAAGIQCLAAYLAACVVFNAGRLMGLQ